MTAEQIREAILLCLAQAEDALTPAEIYDRVDYVESKQMLYAQINYLKREGEIYSETGEHAPPSYRLAEVIDVLPDDAINDMVEVDEYSLQVNQSSRFVWFHPSTAYDLAVTIKDGQAKLSARRVFPVTPALLRQMANLIEVNT